MEPSQVRGEECREAGRFCEERAGSGRAGGTGGLWHHAHLRALPCREVRRWGRAEGGVPGLRVLRYGSGTTSWTGAFLQLLPETQPQQRCRSCERCSLPSSPTPQPWPRNRCSPAPGSSSALSQCLITRRSANCSKIVQSQAEDTVTISPEPPRRAPTGAGSALLSWCSQVPRGGQEPPQAGGSSGAERLMASCSFCLAAKCS